MCGGNLKLWKRQFYKRTGKLNWRTGKEYRKTVGKTPNAIGLSQEGCSRLVPGEALAHIGAKS